MKKQSEKLSAYFGTILEIIEDKPSFLIPTFVYCLLVQMLFQQIAGYIFSTYESKPLSEGKISFIAHLNEISPFTFLLFLKGNDTLSLLAFGVMNFIMYFYFLYVGILTYIKKAQKYFFQQNKRAFRSVNQFLNIFFTFYWWFFYTPFLEINSGVFVCSSNSFLKEYRNGDCSGKPTILTILAAVGLLMAFITAVIIVVFFRNYEFNDQNYLKRRYNNILLLQLVGRLLLTFFYYLDLSIGQTLKHFIAQGLGLSFIFDISRNWPFNNHTVSRFFFCCTIVFEVAVICCHLWIFTDTIMKASEFFYFFVFISTLSASVVLILWQFKYEVILKLDVHSFHKQFRRVDFFLEELVRLLADSQRDEASKFKLITILTYHKSECRDNTCHCQDVSTFLDAGKDVSQEDTYRVIDSIFQWSLNQRLIRQNSVEFEHLSLKYISYLAKYRNNTSRAYYELKILLSARSNSSFYFKSISKILSKTIEEQMSQALQQRTTHDSDDKVDMDLSLVWEMEEMKSKFVPTMISSLKEKIEFWEKMKLGFPSMADCIAFSVKKIRTIQNFNQLFGLFLNRLDGKQKNSYLFYKICSMFELLVKNQIVSAAKLEISAAELKKRDSSKPTDAIHNSNIANQQLASFIVSFSKRRGQIISNSNSFLQRFFGFDEGDKENLQQINFLMPPFLASIHNELMENMNWKGSSRLIKGNLKSFCRDKTGFIYPVKVFLDHSFGHFDDFCLLSSVLKIQNSYDYLLFDSTGKILGISKNIFSKLFSYDKNITLNSLCRKGFVFLLFQDILQDILNSSKEIQEMTIQDSNITLTQQKKASINLTLNFAYLFDTFQMFLNQQNQGKMFDFKDAKTVFMSKYAVSSPKSMQESQNSGQGKSEMKSLASSNNQHFDLFSPETKKLVTSFLDQYLSRKQYISNNKATMSSGTSLYRQDSTVHIRLFFKYTLDYQILHFNKNQSQIKLFQLTFSDATIQKKKLGSSSQSNPSAMSMLTYLNSGTFLQGQMSVKGKSIHSKGNLTEKHTSSDEKISPKGEISITNNISPKLDVVINPPQPLNKHDAYGNDDDDNNSSNWTKVKDEHHEEVVLSNSQEMDKSDDKYSQINMQQGYRRDNAQEPDYEDMGKGLENILEAPNKDEDSTKTKDQKNQSQAKQYTVLLDVLNTGIIDSKAKIGRPNDSTKLYDISKIQTGLDEGSKIFPKGNYYEELGVNLQRKLTGNNILPSMISDLMMNESNAHLYNNFDHTIVSPDESARQHGNSMVNHSSMRNNLLNDMSVGGDALHSYRTDNPLYSDRQQELLIAPMSFRNTDFFSPTNETTQQGYPLTSNDILPTKGEERTYGNIDNPLQLRFTSRNKTESIIAMTNQMTLEEQIGNAKANAAVMSANDPSGHQSRVDSDIEQIFDLKNNPNSKIKGLKKSINNNSTNDAYLAMMQSKESNKKDKSQYIQDAAVEKQAKIKKKKYSLKDDSEDEKDNDENAMKQSLASHTSIRSSYGTQYVREIISSKRLPLSARQFNVVQQVFLGIFLLLTLLYILYLSTEVIGIASSIAEFTTISSLINSYGKGLLGTIGLFSINQNLYTSTLSAKYAPIFKQNVDDASEAMQLSFYELNNMLLTDSLNEEALVEVQYDYQGTLKYVPSKGVASVIRLAIEALFTLKEKSTLTLSSLQFLKSNYMTYLSKMDQIRTSRDSKVSDLQTNVRNLFIIFTSLSCIFCLFVAVTGLPLIHKMNIYKEKIILLVTRINFTEADTEIEKYKVCLEQLNTTNEAYLHIDFFQIFTSRRSKKFKNKEEYQQQHNKKVPNRNNNNNNTAGESKKHDKKSRPQQLPALNSSTASIRQNKFKQNIVSSAIQDQKLGLSRDFIGFFSTSMIAIAFFSSILAYVINSYEAINKSIIVSQLTDQAQISLGAFYSYSELLAVEQQLQLGMSSSYPLVTLTDRVNLSQQMLSHLTELNQFKEENLSTLYGSNVISSDSLTVLRNLYEKNLCLVIPESSNCLAFPQGISGCLTSVSSLVVTENVIFSEDSFPTSSQVTSYLNSDLHEQIIVFAYLAADKAITLFSKIINEANQKVLKDAGHTIQLLFSIGGPGILVCFLLFFLRQWINLKNQLNSLNNMLIFIPEDRLSDEIMLQMLKTLKTF